MIDADGLNAFAGRLERLAARGAPTVLTPHAGELGRLLDRDSEEIAAHRLAAAREAAAAAGCGASSSRGTTRSSPTASGSRSTRSRRRLWPRPAAATSSRGSSRRSSPAAWSPSRRPAPAVLAHARAGRDAALRLGAAESVIATDVIDSIPVGMRPDRPVE